MVGARRKDIYAKRAKERQKEHGGTAPGKKKNTGGNGSTSDSGKARDQAGAAVGVSGKSVDHASKVIRKDFTIMERVAIGKTIEAELGLRQGQRTDLASDEGLPDRCPEVKPGEETRDAVAQNVGFGSGREYDRANCKVSLGSCGFNSHLRYC